MAAVDMASLTVAVAAAISSVVVQCHFLGAFLYFGTGFDIDQI
jgi:hypothetical protein